MTERTGQSSERSPLPEGPTPETAETAGTPAAAGAGPAGPTPTGAPDASPDGAASSPVSGPEALPGEEPSAPARAGGGGRTGPTDVLIQPPPPASGREGPPVLSPPRPVGARRIWPRSFTDRLTSPLPGVRAMARFAREGAVRPSARRLPMRSPASLRAGPDAPPGADTIAVTWAGHASWVVRIGGLTVLTDPVWSRRILGTPARITPVGVAWEDLPTVDAVVISHNHYDHLDAPTLRRLPRATPLFVPAGLGRWCRSAAFTRVTELDWWEGAELHVRGRAGALRLRTGPPLVQAHPHRHLPLPVGRLGPHRPARAAGVLRRRHRIRPLVRRDRPPLPRDRLGAAAHRRLRPALVLRPVHTDPEEAVLACQDLGARRMAPMHWATFLLSGEPPWSRSRG